MRFVFKYLIELIQWKTRSSLNDFNIYTTSNRNLRKFQVFNIHMKNEIYNQLFQKLKFNRVFMFLFRFLDVKICPLNQSQSIRYKLQCVQYFLPNKCHLYKSEHLCWLYVDIEKTKKFSDVFFNFFLNSYISFLPRSIFIKC